MHNFIARVDKNRLNTNHHHSYKWPVFCVFSFFLSIVFFLFVPLIYSKHKLSGSCAFHFLSYIPYILWWRALPNLMVCILNFRRIAWDIQYWSEKTIETINPWKTMEAYGMGVFVCPNDHVCSSLLMCVFTVHMHKHTHTDRNRLLKKTHRQMKSSW